MRSSGSGTRLLAVCGASRRDASILTASKSINLHATISVCRRVCITYKHNLPNLRVKDRRQGFEQHALNWQGQEGLP